MIRDIIDPNPGGIVTKQDIKDSVVTVADSNITLSGEQTINGVLTSASRVGVVGQSAGQENGTYTTGAGAWVRTDDANESSEVTNGFTFFVSNSGSTKNGNQYILITADPIVLGTTILVFTEIPRIELGTTSGTACEGDDSRLPTQDENDALVGTQGSPSTSNKYVTDSDPRLAALIAASAYVVYFSKDGNDSNSGLNSQYAKLTIGSAITAAATLTPAVGKQVLIVGLDGGIYDEAISMDLYTTLFAPSATITSSGSAVTIYQEYGCEIYVRKILNTGTGNALKVASGASYVKVQFIEAAAGRPVFNDGDCRYDVEEISSLGAGVAAFYDEGGGAVGEIDRITYRGIGSRGIESLAWVTLMCQEVYSFDDADSQMMVLCDAADMDIHIQWAGAGTGSGSYALQTTGAGSNAIVVCGQLTTGTADIGGGDTSSRLINLKSNNDAISTNAGNISTNTGNISTNTTAILNNTNKTNLLTQETTTTGSKLEFREGTDNGTNKITFTGVDNIGANRDYAFTDADVDFGDINSNKGDIAAIQAKTDRITNETATVGGKIDLFEGTDNGAHKTTIQAPASIASNRTITIPDANVDLGQIATNAGNISTNTTNIGDNTSDIGDNQTDISNLQDFVDQDVKDGSTPTLGGDNFSNIPQSAVTDLTTDLGNIYTKSELNSTGGASDRVDWSQIKNKPAVGSENWLDAVNDNTAKDAIVGMSSGDCVLVRNDGDGKAAQYEYNGSAWVKIADVDWTPYTGAEIKSLYEGEANTNAFTDTEKTNVSNNTTHAGLTSGNPHNVTADDLNLVIGSDTQAHSDELDSIATIGNPNDDSIMVGNSGGWVEATPAEARPALGLDIGDDVQAYSVALDNVSGTNTGDEVQATTTVSGKSELSTVAEIDTGTDNTRTITPLGLAGSALQTAQTANSAAVAQLKAIPNVIKISTDYTLVAGDWGASQFLVLFVATAAVDRTITLPAVTGDFKAISIYKSDSGIGKVIIQGNQTDPDKIDGVNTYTIIDEYQSVTLDMAQTDWMIRGRKILNNNYLEVSAANYTVLDDDGYTGIYVTTGAGDRTITLPTVADNDRRIIVIKKVDSGAGKVIVDGEGSETIDGHLTANIPDEHSSISIQAVNGKWYIIEEDGECFGEMYQTDNSSATAITVVNQWEEVDNFSAGELCGITFAGGGDLTLPTGGHGKYQINASISGTPETANHVYEFALSVDDVVQAKTKTKRKFSSGTDAGSVSLNGILDLVDAEVIKLEVRNITSGTNGDFTVENSNVVIHKI